MNLNKCQCIPVHPDLVHDKFKSPPKQTLINQIFYKTKSTIQRVNAPCQFNTELFKIKQQNKQHQLKTYFAKCVTINGNTNTEIHAWKICQDKKLQCVPHLFHIIDSRLDIKNNKSTGKVAFLFEHAEFGELWKIADNTNISFKDWINFCKQVILSVLSLRDIANIHHVDICLQNFLVFPNKKIKITDLGSVFIGKYIMSEYIIGKVGKYESMPPEMHTGKRWTVESIQTFQVGYLMFCLMFGIPPFIKTTHTDEAYVFIKTKQLGQLIKLWNLHDKIAHNQHQIITNLFELCLSPIQTERPTLTFILNILNNLKE